MCWIPKCDYFFIESKVYGPRPYRRGFKRNGGHIDTNSPTKSSLQDNTVFDHDKRSYLERIHVGKSDLFGAAECESKRMRIRSYFFMAGSPRDFIRVDATLLIGSSDMPLNI